LIVVAGYWAIPFVSFALPPQVGETYAPLFLWQAVGLVSSVLLLAAFALGLPSVGGEDARDTA